MEDKKLYMNLQKITYFNNEFGLESIDVLTKLFLNKNARYPITQISLVDVKKCVTIEPLLKALISKDNYLQTLIIPKLNMSDDSNNTLCEFIK